jgi:alkylhydroperoxidase/carboxymuconolactone decarboxylase family protein YurZ
MAAIVGDRGTEEKEESMDVGRPPALDTLQSASPEGAKTYFEQRAPILENPELQAVPLKYKLLVGTGVGVALQSRICALMWTQLAHDAGASKSEVAEAILVSRLMKMATVNESASDALTWDGGDGH